MIVSCASCQSKFKVDPAKIPPQGARIRCPRCKGIIVVGPSAATGADGPTAARPAAPAPGTPDERDRPGHLGTAGGEPAAARGSGGAAAPTVVIAHANQAFCDTLASFLRRQGFAADAVTDGPTALSLIQDRRPLLAVVDVALPNVPGYTLCERIKSDLGTAGVKVVLVGAIYDRTRYRRPPQSLYGADAYIEKHDIPQKLVPMLKRLLAGETIVPDLPAEGEAEAPGRPAAPPPPPAVARPADDPQAEQARRLARIIVSDIVLYNPDAVKRGLAEGNLADLVKDELKEGRELLKARVGAEAAAGDYVLEALEDYVARMSARNAAAAPR